MKNSMKHPCHIVTLRYCTFVVTALFLMLVPHSIFSQCSPTSRTIEGRIFTDKNLNGIFETTESGKSGILVQAYDASNQLVGSTLSGNIGSFSISGLTDGSKIRLVFGIAPPYGHTKAGANNGTNIQFVQVPACNVGYGLSEQQSLCNEDTEIITTCFVQGSAASGNISEPTIVATKYGFDLNSNARKFAMHGETGSIWGLAYRKSTKEIFSSAFVKQYSGLKAGHDAIFRSSYNGTMYTTELFKKLGDLGQTVGTLSVTDINNCSYGSQVGKIGLGAIVVSPDDKYLYVVNIFNNTLVRIDIANPTTATTTAYQIPGNGYHAFALKYHDGKIYVGITKPGVDARVMSFDPELHTFTDVGLTIPVGAAWTDTPDLNSIPYHWLTDIDFSDKGDMIIALADRIGHTYCNSTTNRLDEQKGDILIAFKNGNGWQLEDRSTPEKEFFSDENWVTDPKYHPETTLGGIYVMPGQGSVVSVVFDPDKNSYSGGLHRYSTESGKLLGAKELYTRETVVLFGKASGFGDIVATCPKPSNEIGNLVWIDVNKNGLQDADEQGLSNVTLNLYDDQCKIVGSTQTDANGRYYFNDSNVTSGINNQSKYYVGIDPEHYNASTEGYVFVGSYYNLTKYISGQDPINSDPGSSLPSCGMFEIITNDIQHNFDIGLSPLGSCNMKIKKTAINPRAVKVTDVVTFRIEVQNNGGIDISSIEIGDKLPLGYTFSPASNPGWTLSSGQLKITKNKTLIPGAIDTSILNLTFDPSVKNINFNNEAVILSAKDGNGVLIPNITSCFNLPEDGISNDLPQVCDLALIHRVNEGIFAPKAKVTFTTTVCNQGSLNADEYEIVNYVEDDLKFNTTENLGWVLSSDKKYLIFKETNPLVANTCRDYNIIFTLSDDAQPTQITNIAEINTLKCTGTDVDFDFDSSPDNNKTNDKGGQPNTATDNVNNDHGITDEDDHDPATLKLDIIDLSITKSSATKRVKKGDKITFDLDITNEGLIPVSKVKLVDYLPPHLTLKDASWTLKGNIAEKTFNIPGNLQPGQSYRATIICEVNELASRPVLINNVVEIAEMFDQQERNISLLDIDSTPDDDPDNDGTASLPESLEDDISAHSLTVITPPVVTACGRCLPATTPTTGMFETVITFVGARGDLWQVHQSLGLSDTLTTNGTSPMPLSDPYVLDTTYYSPGYSTYIFKGMHFDGQGYSIRFINKFGETEEVNVTPGQCRFAKIGVSGPQAVCLGSSTSTYVATVPSGTITWVIDNNNISEPSDTLRSRGNRLDTLWLAPGVQNITVLSNSACVAPAAFSVTIGDTPTGSMSCITEITLPLDNDCSVQVTPSLLSASELTSSAAYTVMLIDKHGKTIPNATLTAEHAGTKVMAKLIEICSGNSCWAWIAVEDKIPPVAICKNIELSCFALENYAGPFESDNCGGPVKNILVSETITPVCKDTILKFLDRVYVAIDRFGNRSDTCRLRITVLRPNLTADRGILTFPKNRMKDTKEECDKLVLDDEGRPNPFVYGVPKYGPYEIYPIGTEICNIISWFEDKELKANCVKKIIRTWHVYEQCGDTYQHRSEDQVIEIIDNKGPRIEPIPNVSITTSGHDCSGELLVNVPTATDTCNNLKRIDIIYPGGIITDIKQPTKIRLPVSSVGHVITVRAYDECHNTNQISYTVRVIDNTAPTAICKGQTVAALNSNGEAYVYAKHVNDGSYDECDLSKILIRKMNPTNCQPCAAPEIPGFTYIGEYLNSGKNKPHHYYVSKHRATPVIAAKTANAVGGYLVHLNNSSEDQWVYNKYLDWKINEDYIIGLRDPIGKGEFSWYSGQPSNFRNWEVSYPKDTNINHLNLTNDSIYVRVKQINGKWINFGKQDDEFLYIVEVEDACGFSESIKFCCTDARSNPHVVVFRAVDKSGNWNECMVNVDVQDKFVPQIICPPDATMDCSEASVGMDLSAYGRPTVIDACSPQDSMLPPVFKLNPCRIGTIERSFLAYDGVNTATCTQIITVTSNIINRFDPDRDVDFPNAELVINDRCSAEDLEPDNLPAGYGRPVIRQTGCSMASSTYKDEVYTFATGACYKIIRTWTVIDWCEMERLGGNYIPTKFLQTIKINNTIPPFFVGDIPERDTFITAVGLCHSANVSLEVTGRDLCTPDDQLRKNVKIDFLNDGSIDFTSNGIGHINRINNLSFPVGTSRVVWSFEDACGNIVTKEQLIVVLSSGKPVAVALEKISVAVEPWDTDGDGRPDVEKVCINAASLDASSYSECCEGKPLKFSFSSNPDSTKICFDCRHVGQNNIVQFWVHDCNGKSDFVYVKIDVQDNNNSNICRNLCVDNPINITISGENNICQGRSTTLTASGASSYQWSNGAVTASITVSPQQTTEYTVIGSGSFGCLDTASFIVTVLPSPQVTITGNNICMGGSTTLTASGGGAYLWSTGATTTSISVSPIVNTTYTVTVTATNGCTSSLSRTVVVAQPPVVTISGNTTVCINQSTILTASGGTSYVWSTQATTTSITVTPQATTTYTVTATDTNGCSASSSITVTVTGLTINPAITGDTSICIGESTILTASGGISYRWNTSATTTSISVSPTVNTTYSVTVTDSNGCTGIANKTVIVNPNPNVDISGATVFCPGNPLTLTASGADSYIWSTGQTSSSITVTPATATVYRVTGTDSNGCVGTDTIRVTVGDITNVSIIGNNLICPGDTTTLKVVGGVTYLWSTGATADSIRVAPSVTTTYMVTVTATSGCTAILSRTVTLRTPPNAVITGNLSICPGASTMLTASGGMSYLWSTGATSAVIVVNPAVSMSFTVTVTDNNGCKASSSATVSILSPPNIQISGNNNICLGSSTTLTASGANTYIWSNGSTTSQITVSPITPTTYTVTATAANGCTGTNSVTVNIISAPVATITGADTVCVSAGTILTASGGGSYLWNTGATTASINVTVAATTAYTVTVTNSNGCTNSATKTVNVHNPPTVTITGDLIICLTESTTLTASGGVSYIWSNQATSTAITVSPTVTTTYTVTVTDSKGCTATRSATVSVDPGTLICTTKNFTAYLGPNGSVTVTPADISTGSIGTCPNVSARVTPATFFCNDADRTITVTLIVKNTITNDSLTCTAEVSIRDTIDPVISCPANVTVNCETFNPDAPLSTYGTATATDNCPAGLTVIEGPVIRNLNVCNAGQIIRTFIATDRSGNSTQCVQIINIRISQPLTLGDISFPPNTSVSNCQGIDTSRTGSVRINRVLGGCSRISISFTNNPPPQNPLCAQIITRTWRVVDTCQLLAGTSNGIFTFNQIITVTNQAPVINGPAVINVQGGNEDCVGILEGVFHSASGCNLTLSNSQNNLPNFNISGTYEIGSTTVTLTATDICGNITTKDVIVQVTDTSRLMIRCIKAFPQMTDQLFVDAPISMYYEIKKKCSDDREIIASFAPDNINNNVKRWTCADIETVFSFSLYFFYEGESTHFFTCNNALSRTLDPNNFCGNLRPVVSGSVKTENKHAVQDVSVALKGSGGDPVMSDKDGQYKFPEMPIGGKYDIIPAKNTGHLDGVSTMDLIMIQRHILGLESIASPYQLIAADVNGDYKVTAADLTMLRKVILGIQDHFGDNKSWRMIDKNHTFIDPSNPHATVLPEKYHIASLDNSMNVDWVGIKIGDVNGSYTGNIGDRATSVRSADQYFIINKPQGNSLNKSIPVTSGFDQQITGFQFSAYVGDVESIKISSGMLDVMDYHYSLSDGMLKMSWHHAGGIKVSKDDVLFNIDVAGMHTSVNSIALTNTISPEIYVTDANKTNKLGLKLADFSDDNFDILGNTPNPWNQSTEIKFVIPASGEVAIRVRDITGRVIYTAKEFMNKGENTFILNAEQLNGSGVLLYDITFGNEVKSMKMLNIR